MTGSKNFNDEGRLLTKEERTAINDAMPPDAKYGDVFEAIAKAQKDLTYPEAFEDGHRAGIEKCQARVERIKREIGAKLRNRIGVLDKFWDWWQEFWEGVELPDKNIYFRDETDNEKV